MITVDMVMEKRPCPAYKYDDVVDLWAGRESITLLEACDLPIPAIDRVWVLTRFSPEDVNLEVTMPMVTRCIETHALHCGIPAVEAWAKRWLDGSDRSKASAESAVDEAESEARTAETRAAKATWAAWAVRATRSWAAARAAEAAAWTTRTTRTAWAAWAVRATWAAEAWVELGEAKEAEYERIVADYRRALEGQK